MSTQVIAADAPPRAVPVERPAFQPPTLRCREPGCGRLFVRLRKDQVFCLSTCRSKFHRRRAQRSAELWDLAMAWRKTRTRGGLSKLTQTVDAWLREDREAEAKLKAQAKDGRAKEGN